MARRPAPPLDRLYNGQPLVRNTGGFYGFRPQPPAPNIDARTVMSPEDQAIAARGTAASPMGDWSRTFTPAANRAGIQRTGQVTASPTGATSIASNPHASLKVNSPAVQSLLDKAASIQPTSPTNTATAYGTGSVRFDNGAPTPSSPIVDANGVQTGVGRTGANGQPFDIAKARQELYKGYPEVFTPGTPENKAFVAHANQFGEQSAHENRGQILGSLATNTGEGVTSDRGQAENAVPNADQISQSQDRMAAMDKAKADAGPFQTGSVGGNALSAIKNAPGIMDAAGNAVTAGAKAIGLNPDAASTAGNAVRNAPSNFIDNNVQGAKDIAGAAGNLYDSFKNHVANFFTPSASPTASSGAPPDSTADRSTLTPAAPPNDVPNYAWGMEPTDENAGLTSAGQPLGGIDTMSTVGQTDANMMTRAQNTVDNYAKGFAPAMAREKAAIARHVGGAPSSAQPEAVSLPGVGPAVINSSEQVIPNAAGGLPEVLTHSMQKRMKGNRKTLSFA